jgi:hypothetical protein
VNTKTKKIISWILTCLISVVFIGSAFMKLSATPTALEGAISFGISPSQFVVIGAIELILILLFIIPRTGILGTILLMAYMGGAVATHLEHGQSIIPPFIIASFVLIVATIRFPELSKRIFNRI